MTDAAQELVERLLPGASGSVRVEVRGDSGSSCTVAASDGVLHVQGSDPVAVAAGLRHYLAEACGLRLNAGRVPALPSRWPDLDPAHRASPWRWRYHLNYCTFGYTSAYWDWTRWEREIDEMALAGVNLPLATVGFEGVWLKVLTDFGLTSERARAYLGSAAFLPWTWMGCVHDHGSPMSESEIAARVELGTRILERQRSLGMTPVLPGFTGYLPEELAGSGARGVDWMGFVNHCLDPDDPQYRELGLALLRTQRELFGSDGFYSVDPFVEGRPPVDEPEAVASYASAIDRLLIEHDPQSVWVLQAWPFSYRDDFWDEARTRSFLGAMPRDRSLILDLWAEHDPTWRRTEGFAGRPWLWTMLHSFGGRPGLYGALDVVATGPGEARGDPAGATLVGIGTTMESLGSNPIVYDLVAEVAWSGRVEDLEHWLREWVRRRYGDVPSPVVAAWLGIVRTCYLAGARSGPPASVVMSRPRVVDDLSPADLLNLTDGPAASEDLCALLDAWDVLVEEASARGASPALLHDVVEVGLDVLARYAGLLQGRAVAHFASQDRDAVEQTAKEYDDVLTAMERLAATTAEFRLDDWVGRARAWGETPERARALERDAKRLLTCWVEPGHVLGDYAGRHWAGLIDGYYRPRWQGWFDALLGALAGRPLDAHGFDLDLLRFEREWLESTYEPARRSDDAPDSVFLAATAARELLKAGLGSGLERQNAAPPQA